MPLINQILTIVFSFIYGIIFYFLLEINYKYIYYGNKIYRIIVTLLFVLCNTIIYFIMLRKINYGIVHIYFLFCLLTGYILSNFVCKNLIVNRKKQWYNVYEK